MVMILLMLILLMLMLFNMMIKNDELYLITILL